MAERPDGYASQSRSCDGLSENVHRAAPSPV